MDFLAGLLPFVQTYGWAPGIYIWSLVTIAPWFFMLARLKNMGYSANWSSVSRLYSELGMLTTLSVLPFAVMGVLADVVFNWTNGTFIFRELPREFLFTSRVERWFDAAEETHPTKLKHGHEQGLLWAGRLNRIMPGHV